MTAKAKPSTSLPFDKLTFKEDPVLFNADVEQVIPFNDRRYRPDGVVDVRVAHRLSMLTDERFIQREQEFEQQNKTRKKGENEIFASALPTEKLWSDLAIERIGYQPREDWKKSTKLVHKSLVLSALLTIDLENDESDETFNENFLIDDSESACLTFRAFFGGITLDQWSGWLTSGKLPQNITLEWESYDDILTLIKRGIAPNALLEVRHYFHEPVKTQVDQAVAMLFDLPDRGKLASSARRDDRTNAEKWIELYTSVCDSADGYAGRIPAWHKARAAQAFFTQEINRLGESVKG